MQTTPRTACVTDGDEAALRRCLADGDWDLSAPLVHTPFRAPLHVAAECGHAGCVKLLLEAGADPRQLTDERLDALALAVCADHVECFQPLLDAGAAPIHQPRGDVSADSLVPPGFPVPERHQRSPTGLTLLALAACHGALRSIKALVQLGHDINSRSPLYGQCAVHAAAQHGQRKALALLIDMGANLSVKDMYGWTVVHRCTALPLQPGEQVVETCDEASCGHAQCLKELFSRNRCLGLLESREGDEHTPLSIACKFAHVAPAVALLAAGADADAGDPTEAGPLAHACAAGCPRLVELLLDRGARYPPMPPKDLHSSPLQAALIAGLQSEIHPRCTEGHLRCGRILLDRRAASALEGYQLSIPGQPPLEIYTFEALVTSAPVDINGKQTNCEFAAHAVRLLLEHGAHANKPPGQVPPIYLASAAGFTEAVEALLEHGAALLPPGRADNALIAAAVARQLGPCTAILRACRGLPQEERRRLLTATVPQELAHAGKQAWEAVQAGCGEDRQCMKLLRRRLQQVGVEVDVQVPPKVPAEGGPSMQQFIQLARALGQQAGAGAAGTGASAAPAGDPQGRQPQHGGPSPRSAGAGGPSSSATGSQTSGTHESRQYMFFCNDEYGISLSQQMEEIFEQRHRNEPDTLYRTIFDPNWPSLSPAKLQEEVRRVLLPLRAGGTGDLAYQHSAYIFLATAVCSPRLRAVLIREDLPGLLADVLTPGVVRRRPPLWHYHVQMLVKQLISLEPQAMAPHVCSLSKHVWAAMAHITAGSPADPEDARERGMACTNAIQVVAAVAKKDLARPLELCPGGADAGRLLYLRACAASLQADPSNVAVVLRALRVLEVAGLHGMVPPDRDFFFRNQEARRLFVQPSVLGVAMQCVRALMTTGQELPTAILTHDLRPLLLTCTHEARRYGLVRLVLEGAGSTQHGALVAHEHACVLCMLAHYADTRTVVCLLQAGLIPAVESRLAQLLANGTGAPALAAAAAAQTPREGQDAASSTLAQATSVALTRTDCWLEEAATCKLGKLAAQLLQAVASAFGTQPQDSRWNVLMVQAIILLLLLCDGSASLAQRLVADPGLHLIIAEAVPRVHWSVAVNMLGLFRALLHNAGPDVVGEMLRQGITAANPFPTPATTPWHRMMARVRDLAADPGTAPVAVHALADMLLALQGNGAAPGGWQAHGQASVVSMQAQGMEGSLPRIHAGVSLHQVYGRQSGGEELDASEAATSRCACCGVAASTPGVAVLRRGRCRSVAFCSKECQARMWRLYGHRQACQRAAAS